MADWPLHVEQHSYDPFWAQNQPAFHAYDYGANIEIKVSEGLASLEKEIVSEQMMTRPLTAGATRTRDHHLKGMTKDSAGELTPRPMVGAGGWTEGIGDWIPTNRLVRPIACTRMDCGI